MQIQSRNTNYINKNHLKFSAMEEKLYVHEMASISRVGPLDRVITALIIYCLAKDVERGGGQVKLPYPLLDFP